MFISNEVRDRVIENWKDVFEEYPEFLKELDGVPEMIYIEKSDGGDILRFEQTESYDINCLNDEVRRDVSLYGEKFRNVDSVRQRSRRRGCSVYYYWEVFWWVENNKYSNEYIYKGEEK
jgi:ligand-binding sensor protein